MNGRVAVFFLPVKPFSYPSSNITGTSSVKPQIKSINHIAYIISWNVWQMDGLKGVIPNSCGERVRMEPSLFGTIESGAVQDV